MKHLKLFNDTASYEAWKNSEDYVLPNVSYTEDGNLYYNTVQIKTLFDASVESDLIELRAFLSKYIDEESYIGNSNGYNIESATEIPEITVILYKNEWNPDGKICKYSLAAYVDDWAYKDMYVLHGINQPHDKIGIGNYAYGTESEYYMAYDLNAE